MTAPAADLAEARALAAELARELGGVAHWVPTEESRARYERVARAAARLVERILALAAAAPLPPPPRVEAAVARVFEEAVFVGGVHKSGTTLMRNLLDDHPALVVLPVDNLLRGVVAQGRGERHAAVAEQAFITLMTRLLIGGPFSGDPVWTLAATPGDLEPYLGLARYHAHYAARRSPDPRGILGALVGGLMALDGPEVADRRRAWVVKDTFHPLLVRELAESFPRARFVHIVRHPAGVIAAQRRKQVLKRRRLDLFVELETLHEGLRLALESRAALGADRYHVLRYEDLVGDPAAEMTRVARFLGIPFDDVLTRPTMHGRASGANTAHPELLRDPGVVSAATGARWRGVLSPAEISVIESYLGPLLDRLGYPRGAGSVARYLGGLSRVAWQYRADAGVVPIGRIRPVMRGILRALGRP